MLLQHYSLYNTWRVVTRDQTGVRFYCGESRLSHARVNLYQSICYCMQQLHSRFPGNGSGIGLATDIPALIAETGHVTQCWLLKRLRRRPAQ